MEKSDDDTKIFIEDDNAVLSGGWADSYESISSMMPEP